MDVKRTLALLWRQRLIIAAVLCIGVLVFALAAGRNRKYTATVSILSVSPAPQEAAALDPSKDPTQSAVASADVPSLLSSATLIDRVGRTLHLTTAQTQRLRSSVKAKGSLGSDVMPVTVTDTDPHRAIAEANAVVAALQHYVQQLSMLRYDLLIKDLQAQLDERKTALGDIDRRIDALTTADPYVSDTTGTGALSTRLVALLTQRDQLKAAVDGDESAAGLIGKRPALTRDLASQEIVQNDPVVQSLRQQYGKDLAQLNNQRAGYTDAFPGLAGFGKQVGREGESLASTQERASANPAKSNAYVSAELDQNKALATLAADRAQLSTVQGEIGEMQSHLSSSSTANTSLAGLRRDRDAGNQAYAQLANRLAVAQADRAQSASINTIVVIDPATSADLALLSRPVVIGAGLGVVFLWLALTLAFVADGADSRLRNRTTIEELYGTRVYGYVG